jgi:hypothetical protein
MEKASVEPTWGVAYYRKLTSLEASRVLFFGLAELTFVRNTQGFSCSELSHLDGTGSEFGK